MTQINQPRGMPFFGNSSQMDATSTAKSFERLSKLYGKIFRLDLNGESTVVVGTQELANAAYDEQLFTKKLTNTQIQARNGVSDGLFTAFNDEENWGIAHRILAPRFGPKAIRDMYPEMHEICCQLVSKWAKDGPSKVVDPTTDFTRLSLDTIALSAMGTRFDSFSEDEMHPFPMAMLAFLKESEARSSRSAFMNDYVYRAPTRKYWENIETMHNVAGQAVKERRKYPVQKSDLLNAMLLEKDPKTGMSMSEASIINNAITFLIAGQETTSGLLSFLFLNLLTHPRTLRTAQEEVDRVIGKRTITASHMNQLPYLTACLRETLRLWPTAPFTRRVPRSDRDQDYPIKIGEEQFELFKNDVITINTLSTHRDPAVYEEANEFVPERMLDNEFSKLPPNAWKPFGNGARSCIGQHFAWQASLLAVAMILQNFSMEMCNPFYQMEYGSTLTLKPTGFAMRASLRDGLTPASLQRRILGGKSVDSNPAKDKRVEAASDLRKPAISILYGSNSGTCESLAQSLANSASANGYHTTVKTMDSGIREFKRDQPVVIVTSTYEGEPPSNACHFVEWVKNLERSSLMSFKYALFGCGRREWRDMFHKVPYLIDDALLRAGATRITPLPGFCDASDGHVSDLFDTWIDVEFWPGMEKIYGKKNPGRSGAGLDIDFEPGSRTSDLRSDVREGFVLENKVLTSLGEPLKKSITIQLPSGTTYMTGDFLGILPIMPETVVRRVMARFNLAWDTRVTVGKDQHTFLPVGKSIPVFILLSAYVKLDTPCTKRMITTLAGYIEDEGLRDELEGLDVDEITTRRISILEILERYPNCCIPFGDYLSLLVPLNLRQFSISSSPLENPDTCALTYGVSDQAVTADGKRFIETASNFLSKLAPGDKIQISVRPSHQAFHPPADVENVPIIMVCTGTGVAPFHGFVAERVRQKQAGRRLAPALLFIGCRRAGRDTLYAEDFAHWMREGVVDVRYAFSCDPGRSGGCRYVQDRLWKDREEARKLWNRGGRIFVSGNSEIGQAVRDIFVDCALEAKGAMKNAAEREKAEAVFKNTCRERFTDVFE